MTTETYHCHHCGAVPAEIRCTVCGALCCQSCMVDGDRRICAECLIQDEECDE